MPDYSKAKIYKIVCNITGETYYGSTVQKISQRMGEHRKKDNVCCSKPIIERGDYHYGLVEDYKCENSEQLRMRERYYVDNNDCINKISPITSKEEKIAYKIAYNKVYQQEHKEETAAYIKVWREEHKEDQDTKKKLYYETNKEDISAQKKLYYETNKERISAQKKAKYLLKKQAEK